MKGTSSSIGRMVRLALLAAVLVVLSLTPLGYLKAGVIEITFLMIPVVIGGIILGPGAGALLGTLFGVTSFLTCYGIGVPSAFGAVLAGINPFLTFVTCLVPRVLAGWLAGLLFRWLYRFDRTKFLSFGAASLAGALLNTLLFTVTLMVCFGRTDYILEMRAGQNLLLFMAGFVGINGLVEAAACLVAGTAISKALQTYIPTPPAKAKKPAADKSL